MRMILVAAALWAPAAHAADPRAAHWACLEKAADAYDDSTSSPQAIAAVIAPLCYPELDAVIEANTYRSARSKRMATEMMRSQSIETAALIVLDRRRKR